MDRIFVDGKRFVDEHGRERIFHGVNYGAKNYLITDRVNKKDPIRSINDELSQIHCLGMNVVRYFVNWSLLEPKPGKYSKRAFAEMQTVLDTCYEKGMYVYIDMHQDLYSDFGEKKPGDGAPQWACLSDGKRFRQPLLIWAEGYFFSAAVHNSYDNFWNNTPVEGRGLQDRFCDLWGLIAKKFGSHPAVIGFDLLNEPFPGSDGKKVFFKIAKSALKTAASDKRISKKTLLKSVFKKAPIKEILDQFGGEILADITAPANEIIERFDREKYTPFINKAASAIRRECADKIILTENSYYSNLGIPFSGGPVSVNGSVDENQAFAPHAYDFMVDSPIYKYANNSRVKMIFDRRKYEQDSRLQMPVIVGEWGGGDKNGEWLHHAEFLLDLFDEYKWSSIYWAFSKDRFADGVNDTLCRPYPVAVCGNINKIHYDKNAEVFELDFSQDSEYDVPTEIFCHRKPKNIVCGGEYELSKRYYYTYILKVKTVQGENKIRIEF